MATTTESIARPGTDHKDETPPCGCAAGPPRRGGGRDMERCPEGERLWGELLEARDELKDAGHRPPKALIDAFAAARDRYHDHIRGEAS